MKKFFILFLALTFVLSLGTFVFAGDGGAITSMKAGSSVTIGGDARIRGVWQNDYDLTDVKDPAGNGVNDADDTWYDQRIRLNIDANVGNGIEVRSRLTSGTNAWDGGAETEGNTTTTALNAVGGHTHTNTTGNSIDLDYMYLHIPVSTLVINAGNMHRNWGNKLFMWDVGRDTLQVTTNVGDTQVGLYTDKINETRATATARNLNDEDNYGVFVNHTAANLSAGLIAINQRDDRGADNNVGQDRGKGTQLDAYFNTSVGAINIAAEVARFSGNMNTDAQGEKPLAGFVYVSTDVGAINVNAFAAVLKNGFIADSHLTPTVFFGTDNPTAVGDVMAAPNSTTKAFAVGAGTDISSDLSVSAKLAYFDLENLSGAYRAAWGGAAPLSTGKEDATEIDLGIQYKLADNALYSIDFGYFMPDDITLADDEAMALAHKIEVAF